MYEFVELKYKIPWFYFIFMSILLCGLIGGILAKFYNFKENKLILLYFTITIISFGASFSFSFVKLKEINSQIENNKIVTIRGKIDKVDVYGGKDIVFISGKSFEVKDHNLYCLSDRGILKQSDSVELKYVDLGRWAGFEQGNCILEVSKL